MDGAAEADVVRLRTDELTWREVDDEIVALDLRSSRYFSVNGTGSDLWKELAGGGATRQGLVETLAARYDVDTAQAETDVDEFLRDLAEKGLLES
jgi:hypothetical protein